MDKGGPIGDEALQTRGYAVSSLMCVSSEVVVLREQTFDPPPEELLFVPKLLFLGLQGIRCAGGNFLDLFWGLVG